MFSYTLKLFFTRLILRDPENRRLLYQAAHAYKSGRHKHTTPNICDLPTWPKDTIRIFGFRKNNNMKIAARNTDIKARIIQPKTAE